MEMRDRKYMFCDKSTFGSSQNGQNIPKKGQKEKICFFTLNKGQLPTLLIYFCLHFTFPLMNMHVFNGIRE